MSESISFKLYQSPAGNIDILVKEGKLIKCKWSSVNSFPQNDTDIKDFDKPIIERVCRRLDEFFSGEEIEFDFPIVCSGSDFQKRVWEEIAKVGHGKVITYRELAVRIGNAKAVRAVANACGKNPIVIFIPCHRVVGSGGRSGGYTGGIEKKLFLLNLEKGVCNAK